MPATRAGRSAHSVDEHPSENLRPSEAILWTIERDPVLRSTIVVVALLAAPPDVARLRQRIEGAAAVFPRLRQRVHTTRAGQHRWVDVGPLDLDQHVHHMRLPAPGTVRQVLDLGGAIVGAALDPARPLWEMTVVDGLDDAVDGKAVRAAIVIKVHHVVTDGVGGVGLLSLFADAGSDPADGPTTPRRPRHARSGPLDTVRAATTALAGAARHPDRVVASTPRVVRSIYKMVAPATSALSPLTVGRSLDRRLEVCEVALDDLAAAGHAVGGTVNDAFMAAVVGGLRRYHQHHGVDVHRLRVTMPISTRRNHDDPGGNRFTPARFTLPSHLDDAADCMRALGTLAHAWQREPAVKLSDAIADALRRLPAGVTTSIFASMLKGVDFVATNVPGPRHRSWLGGAELVRLYGFGPPSGAALSFTLVSQGPVCGIGLNVDTAAIADTDVLLGCVARALDDVVAVRYRDPPPALIPVGPRLPDHLSALDTSFLRIETPTTPMHIGALVRFTPGVLTDPSGEVRLADIRAALLVRLDRAPRMKQRIVEVPFGLDRPAWEDDDTFDIADHVDAVRLDPPGSDEQLAALCSSLQMRVLPRERPLWAMTFVNGLADGGTALVYRVHHAVVDGISAGTTFEKLFGDDAVAAPPRPSHAHHTPVDLMAHAVLDRVTAAGALLGRSAAALAHPGQVLATSAGLIDLVGNDGIRVASSLNRTVGGTRRLTAVRVPLDDVKAIGRRYGVTVNDVVLAAVTAGLRQLLVGRGDEPTAPLNALVPVSIRRPEHRDDPGNEVTAVIVHLPVATADPGGQLADIATQTRRLKAGPDAAAFATLLHLGDSLPPAVVNATGRLVHHQPFVNLVVTNVPGPPATLRFLGAEVTEIVPIVPLAGNLTVGVAVLSYAGGLVLSLHADAERCPDLDHMAAGVTGALRALRRKARPAPATAGGRR